MILLKSKLKAKGCFPTALNFLLQCQMQELLGEGDKGALPRDQPLELGCGSSAPTVPAENRVAQTQSDQFLTQWKGKHCWLQTKLRRSM